jgi:hypothetical protein
MSLQFGARDGEVARRRRALDCCDAVGGPLYPLAALIIRCLGTHRYPLRPRARLRDEERSLVRLRGNDVLLWRHGYLRGLTLFGFPFRRVGFCLLVRFNLGIQGLHLEYRGNG